METININLKLPQAWSELSDYDLRFVFRLIASDMTPDEIKTLCLFKWSGLKVEHRQDDGLFACSHHKLKFLLTSDQVTELLPFLAWLDEPSKVPVCLRKLRHRRPFAADFSDVPLEKFIVCDNLFQGYLSTQNDEFLRQMAGVLYGHDFKRLDHEELISVFYWFVSVKDHMTALYPNFLQRASADGNLLGEGAATPAQVRESANAMLRALTKGDISKEAEILAIDTHRALTELDAQAKEYRELNAKMKS